MNVSSRRSALRIVAGMIGYLFGHHAVSASGQQAAQYGKSTTMRLVLDVDVIEIVSRGEVQRIAASELMDALRR